MHTILLVDDDDVSRNVEQLTLQRAGFRVLLATDGASALAQARAHWPDLILMDIQMPILDGYEATRRLKADAELHAIPVAALTANVTPADRELAALAGCMAHIDKPIDPARFAAQVAALLTP